MRPRICFFSLCLFFLGLIDGANRCIRSLLGAKLGGNGWGPELDIFAGVLYSNRKALSADLQSFQVPLRLLVRHSKTQNFHQDAK